jgi:hypothetical protein
VLETEPDEILAQLTVPWFGSGHSGAFLVAKDRDDPIAFLQGSGVKCDEDTAVLGLLAY